MWDNFKKKKENEQSVFFIRERPAKWRGIVYDEAFYRDQRVWVWTSEVGVCVNIKGVCLIIYNE